MELWVCVPNLYFYSGRTSKVMTIIFAYYYYTIHGGVPSNGGIVMASSFGGKSEYFFDIGIFFSTLSDELTHRIS